MRFYVYWGLGMVNVMTMGVAIALGMPAWMILANGFCGLAMVAAAARK